MPAPRPCTQCARPYAPLRRGLCQNCYMRDRNRAGYACSYVDAAPVRGHIDALIAEGMRVHHIARAAGVNDAVVRYIIKGRRGAARPARRVAAKTATALLSIPRKEHHA